jgi:HD superfamily phosphohydrolase
MCAEKLTQVTDYLHGAIPLTQLEKSVLSTEAFNRLHNVLQNSSAYLTYPSNRHSRFSHSLGVLHLAGEVFWSAFLNADDADRGRFARDVCAEVRAFSENAGFCNDAKYLLRGYDVATKLQVLEYGPLTEPLLRRKLAGGLSVPAEAAAFLLLFQAVRLAGLLHDLGHPPFSHVVEYALNDLLAETRAKRDDGLPLTNREQTFLKILQRFQPELSPIHEGIGKDLAAHVLQAAVQNYSTTNESRFLNLVVMHLALGILRESSAFLRAVHQIVDSPLDADRLDYVARDILMTGFADGGFRYTRLLNSFRLRYDNETPLFLPSVQALSTIEDFFERRLSLYAFIVYHHRVAKTDGLLREAVTGLGREYLGAQEDDTPIQGYALPTDISGLWRVLDRTLHVSEIEIVNHYMQWDDAWLLTILRRDYFSRPISPTSKSLLVIQIEEFLSNRKYYYSLFKRPDSFAVIDEAFLQFLGDDFDCEPLRGDTDTNAVAVELRAGLEEYHRVWWKRDGGARARMRERRGFFLVNLFRLLAALGLPRMPLVRKAAERLSDECSLEHVFSVEKQLRAGITGEFELLRGDDIVMLSELSEIVEQLERRIRFFPGFFIYLYRPAGIEDKDLPQIRTKFAELLAAEFRAMVKRIKTEKAEETRNA